MKNNTQAQSLEDEYYGESYYYTDDNRYGYDNKDKNSDVKVQKIMCNNIINNNNNQEDIQPPANRGDMIGAGFPTLGNEDSVSDGETAALETLNQENGEKANHDKNTVVICSSKNINQNVVANQ
ncbi:MAG: hypothetical protein MRJ93_14070 [Nitrososphaeraceae archaeon]|nr:hypothetical protein [Nitrososphaeraceae archaeon]